jgi:hypothetical protein
MDKFHDIQSSIMIWSRNLRKIEAFYGTGIVSYFHFLRWLLFINFLIALSVILLVIVPQTSFTTKYYVNNITHQTNKTSETAFEIALDFLQGTVSSKLFNSYLQVFIEYRFEFRVIWNLRLRSLVTTTEKLQNFHYWAGIIT